MIGKDGRRRVFVIEDWGEDNTSLVAVYETLEGAERYLEEHGYLRLANGAPGWEDKQGWFRHVVEGKWRDEWTKAVIFAMEVRQ